MIIIENSYTFLINNSNNNGLIYSIFFLTQRYPLLLRYYIVEYIQFQKSYLYRKLSI